MDVRAIVTVKTILEEGSFLKASQRLNCAQSTVTFQVRQLENELGLRLFERFGRRMVLSRAGRDVLPHLESILRSLHSIEEYRSGHHELTGQLRLAVAESLLAYKLHPILSHFVEQAPAVRLELQCRNCHDIRNGVLAGDYDMGVYYDVGGHPTTLEVTKFGQVEGILVASPHLPQAMRDFDTQDQVKNVNFVINEPRSVYRERMEHHLRTRNIRMRSTIELWSIEAIKNCVAGNLGVSFLPRFAVERDLAEGRLVEIPCRMQEPLVRIVATRHCNREISAPMRLFGELLATHLCQEAL